MISTEKLNQEFTKRVLIIVGIAAFVVLFKTFQAIEIWK